MLSSRAKQRIFGICKTIKPPGDNRRGVIFLGGGFMKKIYINDGALPSMV